MSSARRAAAAGLWAAIAATASSGISLVGSYVLVRFPDARTDAVFDTNGQDQPVPIPMFLAGMAALCLAVALFGLTIWLTKTRRLPFPKGTAGAIAAISGVAFGVPAVLTIVLSQGASWATRTYPMFFVAVVPLGLILRWRLIRAGYFDAFDAGDAQPES